METNNAILETIDRISTALGQKSFGELRANVGKVAVLLANLGTYAAVLAAMPDDAIKGHVNSLEGNEREQVLRILLDLEAYLPRVRKELIERLEKMAPSQGGRPPVLKDRESMRQTCRDVLRLIGNGYSESQAKRRVAKDRKISSQTMNRLWNQRAILMNELSAPELVNQVISVLSTPQTLQGNEN